MFTKRMITALAGLTLLFGGTSESTAAGISLADGLERGDVLATGAPFDLFTNPNGGQLFELLPGFITGGAETAVGTATVSEQFDGSFSFVFGAFSLVGATDGTTDTQVFMEDTTSLAGDKDLIEFLFTLSFNDGSLTTSNLVLASFVGEFGTDPLRQSGPSTLGTPATGAASFSLTAVNQVPLPAGIVLLLTALGGLVLVRRRATA
ncbi:MAG: VPLPA-CTERM sorting domain-containing protein [Paracoccaceae bacterium]